MHDSLHPARPLTRAHMPSNFDISLDQYTNGRTVEIPDHFGPEQPMPGFDTTYANVIDYIVRITYRIWESANYADAPRQVEYIGDCYASDCRVYDDYGLQHGSTKIIADTHHTTSAFTNIKLRADEIIWAGDAQTGFHTSHLTRIIGTNDGDSRYGPATGKPVDFMVIANCVALKNDIFLEHVLYNTSAMLMQLGIDPMQEAERLVKNSPAGWPRSKGVWHSLQTEGSPTAPLCKTESVSGFDADAFAREVHTTLWQHGDSRNLADYYHINLKFAGTSNHVHDGLDAHAAMVTGSHQVFAERQFQVDEVYWMGNEAEGYLISTRWSMDARHIGSDSPFGPANAAPVQIWGLTQQKVVNGKIEQEWLLFNELDVMMQICAHR